MEHQLYVFCFVDGRGSFLSFLLCQASINFLVNALTQEGAINKENNPNTKKKKKKGHNIVSRPVICVCNDLYTPSLKPLRQAALVLQFPPTNPTR